MSRSSSSSSISSSSSNSSSNSAVIDADARPDRNQVSGYEMLFVYKGQQDVSQDGGHDPFSALQMLMLEQIEAKSATMQCSKCFWEGKTQFKIAAMICLMFVQEDEAQEGAQSCQGDQRTGEEEERGRPVGW